MIRFSLMVIVSASEYSVYWFLVSLFCISVGSSIKQ